MQFEFEHNGQVQTIRLERLAESMYRVTLGERIFEVQAHALADGGWRISDGTSQHVIYTAREGETHYVWLDGTQHTLQTSTPRTRRRRRSGGGGELVAQMPGQVLRVAVQAGDAVQTGQTLLVLEAMKMEIRVNAPHDGIINRMLVQAGDVVQRGQRLVDIQES